MQWFCAISAELLGAALVVGLVSIQPSAAPGGIFATGTVYASELTPAPAPTPIGQQPGFAAPTPIGQQPLVSTTPASQTPIGNPSDVVAPAPAPPPQPVSDQIATVAQQVAQVAQDPSMPVDAKTLQINALANLFNQLVAQWQQQNFPAGPGLPGSQPACAAPCAQSPMAATNPAATPTPIGSRVLPSNPSNATPPPAVVTSNPGVSATPTPAASPSPSTLASQTTADLLRAQIANVAQQMSAISQDSSMASDLKTARLNTLSSQFNQLMSQLQQQAP